MNAFIFECDGLSLAKEQKQQQNMVGMKCNKKINPKSQTTTLDIWSVVVKIIIRNRERKKKWKKKILFMFYHVLSFIYELKAIGKDILKLFFFSFFVFSSCFSFVSWINKKFKSNINAGFAVSRLTQHLHLLHENPDTNF